jgi:hypothetical protein
MGAVALRALALELAHDGEQHGIHAGQKQHHGEGHDGQLAAHVAAQRREEGIADVECGNAEELVGLAVVERDLDAEAFRVGRAAVQVE